jgi:hypothetical protein
MKRKYIFLFGLAVGLIVPFVMALNEITPTPRYQLYFGRVMQNYGQHGDKRECRVCFRLDTQTGKTSIYNQHQMPVGTTLIDEDVWDDIESSQEFASKLKANGNALLKEAQEDANTHSAYDPNHNRLSPLKP